MSRALVIMVLIHLLLVPQQMEVAEEGVHQVQELAEMEALEVEEEELEMLTD
jgi:hypothetical protein